MKPIGSNPRDLNRDRGSLTTPPLPLHRTYGSRIRRFGGLSVLGVSNGCKAERFEEGVRESDADPETDAEPPCPADPRGDQILSGEMRNLDEDCVAGLRQHRRRGYPRAFAGSTRSALFSWRISTMVEIDPSVGKQVEFLHQAIAIGNDVDLVGQIGRGIGKCQRKVFHGRSSPRLDVKADDAPPAGWDRVIDLLLPLSGAVINGVTLVVWLARCPLPPDGDQVLRHRKMPRWANCGHHEAVRSSGEMTQS